MKSSDKIKLRRYFTITMGSLIMVIGINGFVVPMGLYNGGTIGISQIIRTILPFQVSFDYAGIINFLLNIPLFILAYRGVSKQFFFRTLYSLITQTIFFSLITIKTPIISDLLTSCLIGGIISAYGVGITLREGGSSGGFDILGVYFAKKKNGGSVGKLSAVLNACIYLLCAILFQIQIAIYSIIYSFVFSLVVDKIHFQNINVSVMVFTKVEYLQDKIMFELERGVTCWKGIGGYTDQETNILFTMISKYEITSLRREILAIDPTAFIVINEGLQVTGNYDKRL